VQRYGVKVEPVRRQRLSRTVVCPARVGFNTDALAHVGSPLRGRAVEIRARLGDTVKAGDPLVVVESPELGEAQADFFQKRMAVEITEPGIELARVAWERARSLHEQSQGISLAEVQRREAEYKAAVAGRMAAQTAATGAENRLHLLGMTQAAVEELARTGEIAPRYTITAPIDATVVQRDVTWGELVGPEHESLMVLADTRTLWVLADVPEARLGEVTAGAATWISTGLDGPRHEGRVLLVAPIVDPVTRTAQARLEIPADSLPLRPGMFVQVEIASGPGESPPVLAVPADAIQTVEGGPAVFVPVEGEPGTYALRPVRIGPAVAGLVPVHDGLAEGEPVVVSGSFILKADLGKSSAGHEH